jgi:hypothetical protein
MRPRRDSAGRSAAATPSPPAARPTSTPGLSIPTRLDLISIHRIVRWRGLISLDFTSCLHCWSLSIPLLWIPLPLSHLLRPRNLVSLTAAMVF